MKRFLAPLGGVVGILERWLLYPNVVLALTAVLWSACTQKLLNIPQDPAVLALVFALTLVTYNRDRLADADSPADRSNTAERTRWVDRHRKSLARFTGGAALVAAMLLCLRPMALAPIGAGIGFALVYSSRVLPGGRAVRQLPVTKVPYVALLWAVLTVAVPAAAAGTAWNGRAALVGSLIFFAAAALVNLNDLRDLRGDRIAGTLTLPVLLGDGPARLFSAISGSLVGLCAVLLEQPGLGLLGLYIALLALSYRVEDDRLFRWLIEGIGVPTWLAVFWLG
ncbi:UbiA family prenyltransferase [Gloeobacter violaceus]|uniref:Gll3537 protein n=1 Tax=Gloeobacter violaceus (strain ATCC 29082 / PCC 7421) TaxID=251221 RepID=Q7NFI8_GLOVI|nr:UbiA family prenyltransferase [Gloeobacter violaceus]BAC91478.1 gll3537 [Gloeobacter violaceus PCC 7421]